jgi:hypothetical protein
MDTSPEYIKMCEKAIEIQHGHEPVLGDYYFLSTAEGRDGIIEGTKVILIGAQCFFEDSWDHGDFWLPRQDQLQAMLPITQHKDLWLLASDWEGADKTWVVKDDERTARFNHQSYEQNWFAFVMYKKFKKVWTGEDWVG